MKKRKKEKKKPVFEVFGKSSKRDEYYKNSYKLVKKENLLLKRRLKKAEIGG